MGLTSQQRHRAEALAGSDRPDAMPRSGAANVRSATQEDEQRRVPAAFIQNGLTVCESGNSTGAGHSAHLFPFQAFKDRQLADDPFDLRQHALTDERPDYGVRDRRRARAQRDRRELWRHEEPDHFDAVQALDL